MKWNVLTAWVIIIAMSLMIGSETAAPQNIQKDESLRKVEKSPTLDPKIFSNKIDQSLKQSMRSKLRKCQPGFF